MAAASPRIVAELGRPETPDETAARKAASSHAYRSSQTIRNLIAALLATLALVLVIVLAVPRGNVDTDRQVDVAAVAAQVESGYDRTAIVPDVPSSWRVNGASVEGDGDPAWTVVYATDAASGYLRIAQGFDAGEDWPVRVLNGATVDDTLTIAGIEWSRYRISDPTAAGNVSYAIGTDAGADRILIYGSMDAATAAVVASGLADQITALRKEAP